MCVNKRDVVLFRVVIEFHSAAGTLIVQQSGALITAWLAVRVLPGPPRSHTFAEISRWLANSRELAGSAGRVGVSAETNDGQEAFSAELSLAPEFGFPATETVAGRDRFDYGVC
jgi:hypothetical protein